MVIPLRDDTPSVRRPYVTIALVVINVVVYFGVQPRTDSVESQEFLYRNAAIPCELRTGEPITAAAVVTGDCASDAVRIDRLGTPNVVPAQEIYPDKNVYLALLWSMFLHGSLLHLLGNMLFLWIFGNNVEDRFGHVAYAAFYLVTGVAATAAHVLGNSGATVPLIGASGAIAGVMGAYFVWYPAARVLTLLGWFLLELPAALVLGIWFVLQFATNPNEGVAWLAHVGGFVAGAAIALALRAVFVAPSQRLASAAWYDDDDDDRPRFGRRDD
ncbi:MAG TPA: rhomboid family intramembrane serine protease [Acidimicrobiia bacterium]|nr:rhomboid family intramembrane serine protease [Acidimicrobiia bacterium]